MRDAVDDIAGDPVALLDDGAHEGQVGFVGQADRPVAAHHAVQVGLEAGLGGGRGNGN